MENLRIVFMGTPEFAVATLQMLITNHLNVVGVVTAPDRPAGRGQKVQESAVKTYAAGQGIPVLQPTNLKSEIFLADLANLQANVQIVVAFRMLPKAVWAMPKYGTFNLHASLLPDYRGAAPINWVIINGETKTGVTTFFIDDHIDTGEIILQEEIGISPADTAGSLHDKLMVLGAGLVLKTVHQLQQGTVKTVPQQKTVALKTAHKINKDTCRITWDADVEEVYNQIRGLSPYPTAWTLLENGGESIPIKIYSATKEITTHNLQIGHILSDKKSLKIAVRDGFICLLELQWPGKRKMKVQELLNGIKLEPGCHVL